MNNSKGAGGIMRSAPLGLLGRKGPDPFVAGCHATALTHGHPLGYYPAGALAAMVHQLVGLASPLDALAKAVPRLWAAGAVVPGLHGLVAMLQEAETLATTEPLAAWSPEELGEGWFGDEALVIGVAALLGAEHADPFAALRWAVNHGGDSDTTGCVAGALLGAHYGTAWIPSDLVLCLEDHPLVIEIADALYAAADGGPVRTF
jgi:ADP-ribosylglycohydrolase